MNLVKQYKNRKSSFLIGAGSVLNIRGNYYRLKKYKTRPQSDWENIKNDWEKVGDDIWKAVKKIDENGG